uniref:Ig-like domain-containing protein n=1 Tax=Hucho hucho TaxID=62062 RepID=A0A4W5JBM2_9TELE
MFSNKCLVTYTNMNIYIYICSSVSTVSHMSVKPGGSITIPCLYNQRYRNNVKYWCRGYYWSGCSTVVRTDHPKTSGKTSISDINQRGFTVTMISLSPSDSDYYWCVVERKNETDDGVRLQQSVTPGLYVDQQEVTGVVGQNVTVGCSYSEPGRYRNNVKYWCRGYYWLGCSTVLHTDHPNVSEKTSISDDVNQRGFTVTMTSLSPSDSDYYWCIVERKNEADDGVRLQLSVTPGKIQTLLCPLKQN